MSTTALSFRNVDRNDPKRYAHKLLNVILGENMSSRLFQVIREQRGLCYEVQSDLVSFSDAGALQIYLALSPANLAQALRAISTILEDLRTRGVTAIELEEAKSYVIGQNRISLENTSSQMMWAGESLLYFNEWIDPEVAHKHLDRQQGWLLQATWTCRGPPPWVELSPRRHRLMPLFSHNRPIFFRRLHVQVAPGSGEPAFPCHRFTFVHHQQPQAGH